MSVITRKSNLAVVDLAEGVYVKTPIPSSSHAALRSGFAHYPANPRWNGSKIHAWSVGRRWRKALSQGKMIVRSADSMLVAATK